MILTTLDKSTAQSVRSELIFAVECFCFTKSIVFAKPFAKHFKLHRTIGKRKSDINKLRLSAVYFNAVKCKENKHCVYANELVSVNKRVVCNQRKAKSCRFLNQRRIDVLSTKGLKRASSADSSKPLSRTPSMPPVAAISELCILMICRSVNRIISPVPCTLQDSLQ